MKKKKLLILLSLMVLCLPAMVSALTVDKLNYVKDTSVYDITADIGASTVTSTYDNQGYDTYLTVEEDGTEITDLDGTTFDGIKVVITGEPRENGNKIYVTYKVTNTNDISKKIAISSGTDVDFGMNDLAAISRIGKSRFTITQDTTKYYYYIDGKEYSFSECNQISDFYDRGWCNEVAPELELSYGAQFNIELQPEATTSWIGFYDDRHDNKFNNSEVQYYTKNDYLDTGLIFTWNDELAAGQTKEYVAIYSIKEAAGAKATFHNFDKSTSEIVGLVGGSITFPEISVALEDREEGFLYRWCENSNGTGACYKEKTGAILNGDTNYYEIKKDNYGNPVLSVEDDEDILDLLVEGTEAYNHYNSTMHFPDDVSIVLEVEDYGDRLSNKDKDKINTLVEEKEKVGVYLDAELLLRINGYDDVNITEVEKPISISFKVPSELKSSHYGIIRFHDEEVERIPSTYDEETGIITFETDKFSIFALVIDDIEEETNPNTGDNILSYIIISVISLTGLAGVGIYLKRKKVENN